MPIDERSRTQEEEWSERDQECDQPCGPGKRLDLLRTVPHVQVLPALLVREGAGDTLAGQFAELVDGHDVESDRPVPGKSTGGLGLPEPSESRPPSGPLLRLGPLWLPDRLQLHGATERAVGLHQLLARGRGLLAVDGTYGTSRIKPTGRAALVRGTLARPMREPSRHTRSSGSAGDTREQPAGLRFPSWGGLDLNQRPADYEFAARSYDAELEEESWSHREERMSGSGSLGNC